MSSSESPIHRVPIEVVDKIVAGVPSPLDRIALASASATLSNRYYLPAIASKLNLHKLGNRSGGLGEYPYPDLFCLSDAVQGKPGFAPFFISSVDLSSDRKKITVGITSPIFAEFKKDIPTRSYMFVDLAEGPRATLHNEYTVDLMEEILDGVFATIEADFEYWQNDLREPVGSGRAPIDRDLKVNTKKVDWKKTMAGRLVPATVELLSKRFKCRECKGTGEVIVTPGAKILRRYVLARPSSFLLLVLTRSWNRRPDLIRDADVPDDNLPPYEFDIRCPRCKGYAAAVDQLDDMLEGFEESLPERMEEFDAMMQEMYEDGEYEY
jgi:hypothetical protein